MRLLPIASITITTPLREPEIIGRIRSLTNIEKPILLGLLAEGENDPKKPFDGQLEGRYFKIIHRKRKNSLLLIGRIKLSDDQKPVTISLTIREEMFFYCFHGLFLIALSIASYLMFQTLPGFYKYIPLALPLAFYLAILGRFNIGYRKTKKDIQRLFEYP